MKRWEILAVVSALVISVAIYAVPQSAEYNLGESGYAVERDGRYLSREAYPRAGKWRLSITWSTDIESAWRYLDYKSAQVDAKTWGGTPVALGER